MKKLLIVNEKLGNVEFAPSASSDTFFSFLQALLASWNVYKRKNIISL